MRPTSVELLRRDYAANGGWETFLSYEDPEADILIGLLRLRKCSEDGTFRKELTGMPGGCSLVRELVSSLSLLHAEMGCLIGDGGGGVARVRDRRRRAFP